MRSKNNPRAPPPSRHYSVCLHIVWYFNAGHDRGLQTPTPKNSLVSLQVQDYFYALPHSHTLPPKDVILATPLLCNCKLGAVAVLGNARPGPKSSAGPLLEVFTCFPVMSSFLVAPSELSKAWSQGPWPPCPPKTATD